jgi:phage terminase small subunit
MDFSEIELGPKMQACSERERKFVWFYVTNEGPPNAAQAARDAGYSDSSEAAKVRGSQLMHRERVLAALEEVGKKAFRGLLAPAIKAAGKLIDNDKHVDHSKAVFTTLARLGLGEKSTVDVNVAGEVTVNHTDQALNDLRTLLGLGVAREKLVEIFGFSGLSRYEKMLAEQDERAPKVIEHRADEASGG